MPASGRWDLIRCLKVKFLVMHHLEEQPKDTIIEIYITTATYENSHLFRKSQK